MFDGCDDLVVWVDDVESVKLGKNCVCNDDIYVELKSD